MDVPQSPITTKEVVPLCFSTTNHFTYTVFIVWTYDVYIIPFFFHKGIYRLSKYLPIKAKHMCIQIDHFDHVNQLKLLIYIPRYNFQKIFHWTRCPKATSLTSFGTKRQVLSHINTISGPVVLEKIFIRVILYITIEKLWYTILVLHYPKIPWSERTRIYTMLGSIHKNFNFSGPVVLEKIFKWS